MGLSPPALTIAIHATGLAFAGEDFRLRIESRARLGFGQVLAIITGLIGGVGLLLAMLHEIEAAVWAAAYWWLGALDPPAAAMLYSVDSISTLGASGLMAEKPLVDDGRARGDGRHAAVRHQHGLYIRGYAGLLADYNPPSSKLDDPIKHDPKRDKRSPA